MTPDPAAQKTEQFLKENPVFLVLLGLAVLQALQKPQERPKWLEGCPSPNERLAGSWRGKGSFGHGFGPQGHHRR